MSKLTRFLFLHLAALFLVTVPCAQEARLEDREFDEGSFVEAFELSEAQVESLVVLGKVWGFLKYHHPLVTAGELHWDYELFRVLPDVLDARDAAGRNAALLAWVEGLGEPEPCDPCAPPLDEDVHLRPRLEWVLDGDSLGAALHERLRSVYRNRHAGGPQHYVGQNQAVGNPTFENELAYGALALPDAGYRLLALFRLWNIIEYWFPYRDVIGESWDGVLAEFVPRLFAAETADTYTLELIALVARVKDTHANLWGSLGVQPPGGGHRLPVTVRFAEGKAVVDRHAVFTAEAAAKEASWRGSGQRLEVGDVLLAIDGVPVDELVERWSPYYAASNVPTRLRDIARALTRGAAGALPLVIERDGRRIELRPDRVPAAALDRLANRWHDVPGETFRLLSEDVAYLKLSSVDRTRAKEYVEAAAGTRGLVIDIRGYPGSFVVFDLGRHLVAEPTPFVRFTRGDLGNPGAFLWTDALSLHPGEPRYEGKVVILIDEVTQSQGEYTTMAFRTAPDAFVIGSTTAGADGNVSAIPLPGGRNTMISGIGVFYPDRTPTQRVGIVPDVEVRPTVAGLRAGRDELLEEAVRRILGPDADEGEVRAIARVSGE